MKIGEVLFDDKVGCGHPEELTQFGIKICK